MKIIYTDLHKKHAPQKEFSLGKFDIYHEQPSRAEFIFNEVKSRNLGPVIQPETYSIDKILRIQDPGYVEFLQTAYQEWAAEGLEGAAIGDVFNQHKNSRPPKHIAGKLGYYLADTVLSITPTSWEAIQSSAFVALTGQELITQGDSVAFSLCRPPGHHATGSVGAGYCFLNNAAIAAQSFIDGGCSRVAILDVDYHHGNGTQDIFYARNDVLFTSVHADPLYDYPFFLGHADEIGVGVGEGFNHNYTLPSGSGWCEYNVALSAAMSRIKNYAPDVVIVSLGVDTFENDPISQFKIRGNDYFSLGKEIAGLDLPTLFVMEGGYAVEEVGVNTANVLEGFLQK